MNLKRNLISLVLAATGLLGLGCAQRLDDIDRVQNNVTRKSELRGEFYFRSTVVEAPYASVNFFEGSMNYQTERGVFEVQEKTLYFFRTYEIVIGGEALGMASDIDTPLYQVDAKGQIVKDANGKPVPVTTQLRIGDKMYTVARYVYRGTPVVAFPIESHFDIRREYDPATGEEKNVISENTSDREWWEREHMRVTWGANQLSYMDASISPTLVSAWTPPSVFLDETAPKSEAPSKDLDADGRLVYFDYLSRVVVSAPVSDYDDGEGTVMQIPTCLYYPWYLGQIAECASERVTFRHSFLRVQNSDYVAWEYDDSLLRKFGYYRLERANYDPLRGQTYTGASRRLRRHRMWKNHVVTTGSECKAPNADVTADCPSGQVCEPVGTDGKKFCVAADANDRLDYAKMEPQAIVYFLSEQYPRELLPEALKLGEHWSVPFEDIVKFRKQTSSAPKMFVICENNLTEAAAVMKGLGLDINNSADVAKAQKDGKLAGIGGACCENRFVSKAKQVEKGGTCALMNEPKRNGDLRFSLLASVNAPTSVGLYGYGPSAADPLTGELLSAGAYMYTPAMKRGAATAMLQIELLTGIQNFWETIYANDVTERTELAELGSVQGGLPKWTVERAKATASEMIEPQVRAAIEQVGLPKADGDFAHARMAKLAREKPGLAQMFVTDDVKLMMRDPGVGKRGTESAEQLVERLGQHNWGVQSGSVEKRLHYLEHLDHGGCKFMEEFADNAILGIAHEYSARMNKDVCDAAKAAKDTVFDFQALEKFDGKCNTAGEVRADGAMCNEVTIDDQGTKGLFWQPGCTVGRLKAQLASAIVKLDIKNPFNQTNDYYQVDPVYTDTKNQQIHDSQMVLLDAINKARDAMIPELHRRIWLGVAEHEVGHTLGLRHNFEGSSDAMNFGKNYWDLKGSFDAQKGFVAHDFLGNETPAQVESKLRQLQSSTVMDYGAKFNDRFEGVGYYDRAAIRFGYGGIVDVFAQDPNTSQYASYMDDTTADTTNLTTVPEAPMYLERLFKSRIHYSKIPNLFGKTDALYDRTLSKWSDVQRNAGGQNVTVNGKWEVPYRFCGDELAGRIPTCQRWDQGADSFEIVRNAISDYESYWPIWGYWRNSVTFAPDNYSNRIRGTFYTLKTHMQWWTTEMARFNRGDWWKQRSGGARWEEDENGGLAGAAGVADSVNTLIQTFGRPEPGIMGYNANTAVFEPRPSIDNALFSNQKLMTQLNCDARELYPGYDYNGYLPKATRAGAIYERLAAFEMLADPSSSFLAVDKMNDIQKYLLSFYTLFPKQLQTVFGGLIGNRADKYGWWMAKNATGKPDHCVRRRIVGSANDVKDPDNAWPMNPEPEYTFPSTRFRMPMLAAYYGLGLFLNSYDHSFVDTTRVYIDGHETSITPTPDAELAKFEDPLSGKVYVAVKDATSAAFFPAFEMVKSLQAEKKKYEVNGVLDLKALQDAYNYSEYQYIVDKLELLRDMNHTYDYAH